MATVLETILDNMATAFALINGTGSYSTTVRKVNGVETKNYLAENSGNTPAVGITLVRVTHENDDDDISNEQLTAEVEVLGWVTLQDAQPGHDALVPFWEDVRRLVKANRLWSTSVLETRMETTSFEYGEQDAAFALTLSVRFQDTVGN